MSAQSRKIFISHAHENRVFVDRFRADLARNNISSWIDKEGLKWGTPDWEEAIRAALAQSSLVIYVASPDARRSEYVRDELGIAKDIIGLPVRAVWAEGEHWRDCAPLGYGSLQYADLRGDQYEHGLKDVLAVLTSDRATTLIATPVTGVPIHNPYVGLRAFDRNDRGNFFGREVFIADLIDKLAAQQSNTRLLGIIGPSGSGKSSVIMAGLFPQLMNGALPAHNLIKSSATWRYLDPIKPGTQPIENLARALKRDLPDSVGAIRRDLAYRNCSGLNQLAQRIVRPGERLVVFIDQFEELFTNTSAANEREREQFIHVIASSATEPDGPVQIVLTLRADFYDRPMKFAELNRLLARGSASMPTMTLADLIDAVSKPAERAGLRFEDGLIGDIVFNLRDRIGALPLLQFALAQLGEDAKKRKSRSVTRKSYVDMGGVEGALARHAQRQFDQPRLPNDELLAPDEKERLAHALFRRLVLPGNTEQDVARRRARLSELSLPDVEDTRKLRMLAEAFVRARLLTASSESNREPSYEVSHEALLREWPWLARWIAQNRADITFHQTLNDDARVWLAHQGEEGYLYSGGRLAALKIFGTRHRDEMTPDELGFWSASQKHEERQRNIRRLSFVTVPALVAVVMMAGLAWYALDQRARAQQARISSDLLRQTIQANSRKDDPLLGMAEMIDALSQAPDDDALKAQATTDKGVLVQGRLLQKQNIAHIAHDANNTTVILRTFAGQVDSVHLGTDRLINGLNQKVSSWLLSPDSQWLALKYPDGRGAILNTQNGELISMSGLRNKINYFNNFRPDSQWLIVTYENETIDFVDARDGKAISIGGLKKNIRGCEFSDDSQWLAVKYGYADWDLIGTRTAVVVSIPGLSGDFAAKLFSPNSQWLVIWHKDGTAGLVSLQDSKVIQSNALKQKKKDWGFSADSRLLYLHYDDDTFAVLSSFDGRVMSSNVSRVKIKGWEFSPDDLWLAVQHQDDTWEILSTRDFTTFTGPQQKIKKWQFSADSQWLAVRYEDLTWDIIRVRDRVPYGQFKGPIGEPVFSSDSQWFAVTYEDGTGDLVNAQDGRVTPIRGSKGKITDLSFAADNQYLWITDNNEGNQLFNLVGGQVTMEITGTIQNSTFGLGGQYLVVAFADNHAELFDIQQEQSIANLEFGVGSSFVQAYVYFDASSKTLRVRYRGDGRLILYDLDWLTKIEGGRVFTRMSSEEIVKLACAGPLRPSNPLLDRTNAKLNEYLKACQP